MEPRPKTGKQWQSGDRGLRML